MNLAKILALLALARKYGPIVSELIQQLLEQFKADNSDDARVFKKVNAVGTKGDFGAPCDDCEDETAEECSVEQALYHIKSAIEYSGYSKEHAEAAQALLEKHLAECHDE